MVFLTYEDHFDAFTYATPTWIYKFSLFFGFLGMCLSLITIFALAKFARKEYKTYTCYLIIQLVDCFVSKGKKMFQTNIFCFDLIITLGVAPVALLPLPAAYSTGYLAYSLHMSTVHMLVS